MLGPALVSIFLLVWAPVAAFATKNLAVADNPQPTELPTLSVSEREEWGRTFIYLSAQFPDVPGLICDLWTFETSDVEFVSARPLEGGGLEMTHSWTDPDWDILTRATPEQGAVEVVASMSPKSGTAEGGPETYPGLNVCFQLRSATAFQSAPDPYPDFVNRCFIFTRKGRTFLSDASRNLIPVQPPDHPYNNPPWVQMYASETAGEVMAGTSSWAAFSDDRYTVPVIGAVSRDRQFLTAIATETPSTLSQAWHDCLHNNATWSARKEETGKGWRIRVYGMRNDPEALLLRVNEDFPAAETP